MVNTRTDPLFYIMCVFCKWSTFFKNRKLLKMLLLTMAWVSSVRAHSVYRGKLLRNNLYLYAIIWLQTCQRVNCGNSLTRTSPSSSPFWVYQLNFSLVLLSLAVSLELCYRIRDSIKKMSEKSARKKKRNTEKRVTTRKAQEKKQTGEDIQRHPYTSFIYFKFDAWALTAFMNHLNKSTIQTKQ